MGGKKKRGLCLVCFGGSLEVFRTGLSVLSPKACPEFQLQGWGGDALFHEVVGCAVAAHALLSGQLTDHVSTLPRCPARGLRVSRVIQPGRMQRKAGLRMKVTWTKATLVNLV